MGNKANISRTELARRQALKITLIYLFIGSFWVVFSDMITEIIVSEKHDLMLISILKGIVYVLLTSAILYALIYYSLKKLTDSEEKLKKSETLLRTVVNEAPIGIAISEKNNDHGVKSEVFSNINPMFEVITGRTKEELKQKKLECNYLPG